MPNLWRTIRGPKRALKASPQITPDLPPTDQNHLCARCAKLDLDDLYAESKLPFEPNSWGVLPVEIYNDTGVGCLTIKERSPECSLCTIFKHCSPSRGLPDEGWGFCSYDYTLIKCPIKDVFDADQIKRGGLRVPQNVLSFCHTEDAIGAQRGDFDTQGFIAQHLVSDYDFKTEIPFQKVDFDVLAEWLDCCRKQHPLCKESESLPSKIPVFMIDCKSRNGVQ